VGVEGRAGPPVIMLLVAGEVCHDEAGREEQTLERVSRQCQA